MVRQLTHEEYVQKVNITLAAVDCKRITPKAALKAMALLDAKRVATTHMCDYRKGA